MITPQLSILFYKLLFTFHMNVISQILIGAALCCSTALFAQDPVKILFLGNSFTNANNLPLLVEGLANDAGIANEITMYAPGGMYVNTTSSIVGHDSSAVTESYILSQNWDYIVVQDNLGGYVWAPGVINSSIINANITLFNKIKDNNSCTRVVYFAGWGFEGGLPSQYWNSGGLNLTSDNTPALNIRIYEQFILMNDNHFNEIVSPIGLAFNTSLSEQPSIDLYSPDGMHPSLEGSYLGASTLFSTIFKVDPTGLNYTAGLDPVTANYLRQTGYETVITDSLFVETNLDQYTPDITFTPNEILTNGNYASFQWVLNNVNVPSANTNPFVIDTDGLYGLIVTDENGCTLKSFELFCEQVQTNSTLAISLESAILYPNPADQWLTISVASDTPLDAFLMDNSGRIIQAIESREFSRVDVSALPDGVYFVKLINPSEQSSKMFTVKH
ncbi:MAG: T9SS type A sorting domain-containing protein [Bacteroidetes bacterium]|nr:MAG: T9SS type A sorting domain-containing protein [Bacteroidota bacterium]